MREILIFMKYSLFMGYNEKRRKRKNALYTGLIGFAIGFLLMYFPIREALKSGYSELISLFYSMAISALILFGSILSGIESFSSFKSLDFIISLPVKRSNVFAYIYIINLIAGSWGFGFLLALSAVYASSTGKNLLILIASSILHYVFLSSIGIATVSLIRKSSRSSLIRRTIYILLVIALPIIMFFINGGTKNIEENLKRIEFMMSFLKSPVNITSEAVKPSVLSTVIETLSILLCYILFSRAVQRIELTDSERERNKAKESTSMVSKEIKMIFRMERGVIYLLFPYVFGLIFSWNQNIDYAIFTTLPLIALYTPNVSKNLTDQDITSWNYLRSLPIRAKKLISSKMIAISAIGSSVFTAFYMVLGIVKGFSTISLLSLPISSLIYAFSVPVGVLESLEGGSDKYSMLLRSLPITLSSFGMLLGLTIPQRTWRAPILALSTILLIYFGEVLLKKSVGRLEEL